MALAEVPEAEVETAGRLFVLVSLARLDLLHLGLLV